MSLWLVRAGSHGEFEKKFLEENRVYLTWDDTVDEFRGIAARAAASVVLWLTDQLPKVIDLPEETVE